MFSVKLYNTDKKVNSTKIPSAIIETLSVELKDDCSKIAPIILIKSKDLGALSVNYCYIEKFERYYFITNITWINGIWEVSLKVDVLASYKSQIATQTLYVERSYSDYDPQISDATYPAKSDNTETVITGNTFWTTDDLSNGMYVIGVAGQRTTYYSLYPSALSAFMAYLLGPLYANNLLTNWALIYPSLNYNANPLQFITSIMWFPFQTSTGTSVTSIRVGWVSVPTVAREVSGSGIIATVNTFSSLPRHPLESRGKYLNNAPYASYDIFYPPFGKIQIDPSFIANANSIALDCLVDMRTGEATLTIYDQATAYLHSWLTSQVGVNYQVSQVTNSKGALGFGQLADAVANVANGGGSYKGISGAVRNVAESKIPTMRSIGSTGSINSLRGNIQVIAEFANIIDEDREHRGRPLCELRTINTLNGFMVVSDASVEITALEQEVTEIIQLMEGGFYHE